MSRDKRPPLDVATAHADELLALARQGEGGVAGDVAGAAGVGRVVGVDGHVVHAHLVLAGTGEVTSARIAAVARRRQRRRPPAAAGGRRRRPG
ncbi:MAG: hypothetical protein U0802_23325 [Candidatus Binatia bacterium]